ncbi:MAG: VCBS repeat-containing protein [Phycisphaerales bacterium]
MIFKTASVTVFICLSIFSTALTSSVWPEPKGTNLSRSIPGSRLIKSDNVGGALPLTAVTTGDYNNDGILDLMAFHPPVPNVHAPMPAHICTWLGNGDGTFTCQQQQNFREGSDALSADFNNDGKPDVIYSLTYRSALLLNKGDGKFFSPEGDIGGAGLKKMTAGDFNKDGNMDIAAPYYPEDMDSGNSVGVLLGKGDGTFHQQVRYDCVNTPSSIVSADFNGDTYLDIAVYGEGANEAGEISVLLGNGDGTFQAETRYSTGLNPNAMVSTDINSDGKVDLIVSGSYIPSGENSIPTLSVHLGKGDGTFAPETKYDLIEGLTMSLLSLDWNLDGKMDLVMGHRDHSFKYIFSVLVMLGNGDGTFYGQTSYYVDESPYSSLLLSDDYNSDGWPDCIISSSVYLNNKGSIKVIPYPLPPASPPPPRLELEAGWKYSDSGYIFRLIVDLKHRINDGIGYDGYVIVVLPGGRVYTKNSNGKWVKGIEPIVRNVTNINPFRKVMLSLRHPIHKGTSTFIAGLMPHGYVPTSVRLLYSDIKEYSF